MMFCKKCNKEVDIKIIQRLDTIHEAEIRCSICNFFICWKKKEINTKKRDMKKYPISYFGINYCQLCLRDKSKLGLNETLTEHHILELNPKYKDEQKGEYESDNIWVVCTHCHSLIHHVRTYLNYHLIHLWEKEFKL